MRAGKDTTQKQASRSKLPRNQTTLTGPCSVSGRGYWSGTSNTLTFLPAPANSGVRFVRTDLEGQPSVQAIADFRASVPLRTQLANGRSEVAMIEHVMAALHGLRIDNVEVYCTACEMPGMDGSAHDFALALDSVGKTELRSKRPYVRITEEFRVGNAQQWIQVEPVAHDSLEIEYQLDYGKGSPIGKATYTTILDEDTFFHQLAPARTFISHADAMQLQRQGLAKHVTHRDLLVFNDNGPMNNKLRFSDECARHKALDLLGDLALAGIDLVGRFTACRSGHILNGQVAERIRDMYTDQRVSVRAA